MDAEVIAAWIAATVAILGAVATGILQVVFWRLDQKEKRKQEVMQHRQDALLSALQVIDHVYSNLSFDSKPATNPHQWDITLARTAMNKMIIYCNNPTRTVEAFSKAVGLPDRKVAPAALAEFRRIVCEELELSTNYNSQDTVWIAKLDGGK
jgi:hypothetical protein